MKWAAVALLVVGGCTSQETAVLESTTKEIPVGGGTARSADGLFEVVVPADALAVAAVIDIETLTITGPSRSLSRVYEVRVSELALRPAATLTARYHATSIQYPRSLAIARWPSGSDAVPLAGNEAKAPETVEGQVSSFLLERFCVVPAPLPPPPAIPEGWTAPVATATSAWIFNQLAIAGPGEGFDLDLQCAGGDCIDNYLWRLGELGNDQIRQGLLGGENLLGIELAGLDDPYVGDDASLTAKFYGLRDKDEPFFPANNFKVPVGQVTCCEFVINPQSLSGIPGQARSRSPARIEDHQLFSLTPTAIQFVLTVAVPPHPEFRLERTLLRAELPEDASALAGLIGGVVSMNMLAQLENPYCKTVSPRCPVLFPESTLLDLTTTLFGPPDIDLDGDGLECALDRDGDGRVDLCCDGVVGQACSSQLTGCAGTEVPPIDSNPGREGTCAFAPEMADGYSIALEFTAVPARFYTAP